MSKYILCLNSGSTTLKFHLFSFDNLKPQAWGVLEHGKKHAKLSSYTALGELRTVVLEENDLSKEATEFIIRGLTDKDPWWGLRGRVQVRDISVVCHRIVHGGEQYVQPTRITSAMLDTVKQLSELAPLHNPASVAGLKKASARLPNAEHIAMFDTAFHASLPPQAFLYALPYSMYELHRIRKYGFHGLSHKFIARAAAERLDRSPGNCRLITLHLGGGCSAAAIVNGVSVDTSMGMTPLEGLMMATRSGDVDPGVVLKMVEMHNGDVKKVEHELNSNSGMLGVAGTADFRALVADAEKGNVRCNLALQMFATRIAKIIGSYWVVVGGADAVVFSGGIGENSAELRKLVARDLECLGGTLDVEANRQHKTVISSRNSKFAIMVIRTNEELEMAQQARAIISGEQRERTGLAKSNSGGVTASLGALA